MKFFIATSLFVLSLSTEVFAAPVTGATCIATDGFSHADLVEKPKGSYSTSNRAFGWNEFKLKLKTTRVAGEVEMSAYIKGEEEVGDEIGQEIQSGQRIVLDTGEQSFECTF